MCQFPPVPAIGKADAVSGRDNPRQQRVREPSGRIRAPRPTPRPTPGRPLACHREPLPNRHPLRSCPHVPPRARIRNPSPYAPSRGLATRPARFNRANWFPGEDSNLESQTQNLMCCQLHYRGSRDSMRCGLEGASVVLTAHTSGLSAQERTADHSEATGLVAVCDSARLSRSWLSAGHRRGASAAGRRRDGGSNRHRRCCRWTATRSRCSWPD